MESVRRVMPRPFAPMVDLLKQSGLRPTRQRLALARLLFSGESRHLTAEQLHEEAQRENVRVSLATIYNALHQFTDAGLLREVVVEPGRCYFDTNTSAHHHLYYEETGRLEDVAPESVRVSALPEPPEGTRISRVDVVVRLAGMPGGGADR